MTNPAYDLVVFGATHTKNSADPQLARIDETWNALDPTVALVEGRLGFLVPYAIFFHTLSWLSYRKFGK